MFTHPHHARTVHHYRVRRGDTLSDIARKKHVNIYALARRNHMRLYDILLVGRRLTLPRPGKVSPPMPWHAPVVHVSSPPATAAVANTESPAQPTYTAPPATTPPVTAPPTTEASASYSGTSGFEQCVISRESGGNPEITNSSGHWGLYQFSASTWAAYGGNPADFGSASAGEQHEVFANAMAQGGEDNWSPYDGC